MSFELWLAFVLASVVVLTIPGPTIMLVVGYVLGQGIRTAWSTVPGVTLGDFTAMTVSLLGLGALLAASATLFTLFKFIGAAYLIWLGFKLWRSKAKLDDTPVGAVKKTNWSLFRDSYIATTLNPKTLAFFIAFLPQFMDASQPFWTQLLILEVTFLILATINIILWAVFAAKLRKQFQSPSALKLINRIGGSFLIGAGMLTLASRQA